MLRGLFVGGKELFVFEFGVAVFWGFTRSEEEEMILLIRKYVEQGLLTPQECTQGQDDMVCAYVVYVSFLVHVSHHITN